MIARIRFRNSLYKMILLRNIIENKMHKEKMALLFGFEQFIINTEDYLLDQQIQEDNNQNKIKIIESSQLEDVKNEIWTKIENENKNSEDDQNVKEDE